jgi:hypothetical protein
MQFVDWLAGLVSVVLSTIMMVGLIALAAGAA